MKKKNSDEYFLIDVKNGVYQSVPNDIASDDEKINEFIWENFNEPFSPVILVKSVKSFTHKFVPE